VPSQKAVLVVEAQKVAEFRRATGGRGSAEVVPPTFPVALEHQSSPIVDLVIGMGYPAEQLLHGEEEIDYPNGPLRIGDELTGETRFVGSQPKRGRSGDLELLTTCTELHRPDGELAVRIIRTFVLVPAGSPAPGH
jgi:hypothetical protein